MGRGEPDSTPLQVRLLGVPAAASIVRERLRAWLAALGWPAHEADDVVLAVHEAVSNSIEHGYDGIEPGDVDVVGERTVDGERQSVRVVVRDDGRWRPPRAPGYRGRGIAVMRGCMAGVDVRPGDGSDGTGGTEVVLVSRPVPTARPRVVPLAVATPEVHARLGER